MLNKIIEQWLGEEKEVHERDWDQANLDEGHNNAIRDLKSRIPELEGIIVGEIREMREDCRNDGGIQYLSTYDYIITSLKGDKE